MSTFNPMSLYELAKSLHPDGVGGDSFIPVEVEGQVMELRYFTDRGNGTDVEFRFFRTDARCARREVIVWKNGRMDPDEHGEIPDNDRREGEKAITLSVEELMRIAYDALQRA
jgi:hypothetical protein